MIWRLQTDSSKRLAELDRERSKTATIIESIEDGLIVLDPQARDRAHERGCERDSGRSPGGNSGHAAGKPRRARLARGAPGGRAGPIAAATTAEPIEFKVFLRGRDHSYLVRDAALDRGQWHQ